MTPSAMASDWYCARRGDPVADQIGPLMWEELCARARAGALGADDLVWNPQLPEWLPAGQIPGLVPGSAVAAPAAAPAPTTAIRPPQPAGSPPAAAPYGAQAQFGAGPRRVGLLTWLIPLIAIIIVGAGLGSYFGFFYHHDRDNETAVSTTATSTVDGRTTSTTKAQTAGAGAVELTVPDEAKLVTTTKWGEVPVNEIGVILADGKTRKDADQVAQQLGGTVVGEIEFLNLYQIQTAGATEADLQAALDKAPALPGVELAFPNQENSSDEEIWGIRQSPLNDPAYSGEYGKGYALIGAQKAWNYIKGSGLKLSPVKVGIVDDGLYEGTGEFAGPSKIEYPDPKAGKLANPLTKPKVGGGTVPNPAGSHGTKIAGIIGADPTNKGQTGIASTALGDKLTISVIDHYSPPYGNPPMPKPDPNDPTQYVNADGKSYTLGALAALMKQVEAHATVINCSFGSDHPDANNSLVAAAYTKFFEKMAKDHPDVTFVCAAGNENGELTKTNYFPAGAGSNLPNVITVGNVMNNGDPQDTDSNFSGNGGEVTISAPGEEAVTGVDANGKPITDTYEVGGHYYGGGTSMATPQVAAAAALLLSLNPKLQAADIKKILKDTANPGPENQGGGILSIDRAVLQVINDLRREKDPNALDLTPEQLENLGVIDAVATTTGTPNSYSVHGILATVPDAGTEVTITGSAGVTIGGEASQSVAAPSGEAEWPTVTVADADPKNPPTVTVTRKDSGAASVITFQSVDLNGHWEGALTISDFTFDQATATTAEGDEGCNLAAIAAVLEKLKGLPIPMTMDVTADMEGGTGSAVMVLDMASVASKLNEGNTEGSGGVTAENQPQTLKFTFSGPNLTFTPDTSGSGETSSMTATVSVQGGTAVMTGTLTSSGTGFSMTAGWTVTKQP